VDDEEARLETIQMNFITKKTYLKLSLACFSL
jgi:hypothetical protein